MDALNRQYGSGTVELNFVSTYYSMKKVVGQVPYMVDYAKEAMEACGVEMINEAVRGGTDGSALSQRGLPCPNISAGYQYGHSRFEFASIQSMEKTAEILVELVKVYARHA